jgi:hypothetical protein
MPVTLRQFLAQGVAQRLESGEPALRMTPRALGQLHGFQQDGAFVLQGAHGRDGCKPAALDKHSSRIVIDARAQHDDLQLKDGRPGFWDISLYREDDNSPTVMRHRAKNQSAINLSNMNSKYNPDLYHPSNFDDDMCLKPPLLLWIAAIYLARAILLPIGIGIGHIAGVDDKAFVLLRSLWSAEGLVPALVALPVLYALFRRAPAAAYMTRWFWAHGRILLAVSAGIDAALTLLHLTRLTELSDQMAISIVAGFADLYFLAYILFARRVRDAFTDFPPPLPAAGNKGP